MQVWICLFFFVANLNLLAIDTIDKDVAAALEAETPNEDDYAILAEETLDEDDYGYREDKCTYICGIYDKDYFFYKSY